MFKYDAKTHQTNILLNLVLVGFVLLSMLRFAPFEFTVCIPNAACFVYAWAIDLIIALPITISSITNEIRQQKNIWMD